MKNKSDVDVILEKYKKLTYDNFINFGTDASYKGLTRFFTSYALQPQIANSRLADFFVAIIKYRAKLYRRDLENETKMVLDGLNEVMESYILEEKKRKEELKLQPPCTNAYLSLRQRKGETNEE